MLFKTPFTRAKKNRHGAPNFWYGADDFKARHSQFSTRKRISPKCNVAPVIKILGVPRLPPGGIRGTTRLGYVGTITNLQTVLNTPKNSYLYLATPKNTCHFSNPQKTFDHPCHLKSGVRTASPPPPPSTPGKRAYIDVSYSSYLHPAKYF